MATNTGTYDISSLLNFRGTSAVEFGIDTIAQVLQRDLAAWNALVLEMVSELCGPTTERNKVYGTGAAGEMQETDEYGKTSTQKAEVGDTVAFPLRLFQYNLGWTDKALKVLTPADLANQQLAGEKAHWKRIQKEIKKAIYGATDYDFRDFLVDNVVLNVKRFVNADGGGIPEGPNGESFDPDTHTHYVAHSSWDAATLLTWINSLVEHGHGARVRMGINSADEVTVRGLSGFVPYVDPRVVYRASDTPGVTLDITRLDNRAIGIFGPAEVWVKSWVPDNYPFIWDAGSPEKPLAFRQRNQTALQGLRLAAENEDYPLHVKDQEAEFGVAVDTRTNGVVGYTGGSSYTEPSI